MSQKISAKNLHYDQKLPPFLARLRGEAAGNNDGPDPLLVRNRRHAKPRSAPEEAEDGPLILDEEGNAVSGVRVGVDGTVTETEKKDADDKEEDKNAGKAAEEKEEEQLKHKEKTAGIGATKKRKAVKVIGGDEVDEAGEEGQRSRTEKQKPREKKAKSKKIKLSFGDDEG
jgi:hypothetical protein